MSYKRKIKSNVKYSLLFVVIAVGIYVGFGKVVKSFSDSSSNIENQKAVSNKDKEEIPVEVLSSTDPTIQELLEISDKYPKVNKILSNLSSYPKQLLELAAKKVETIDFVADYVNQESSSNDEKISIKNDYKKGEIPLFIQWDERWGYNKYGPDFIAINGCGPTSLAMVAVGLTDNTDINPKVVVDFSLKNGYLVDGVGSSWSLMTEGAKSFGLRGKELPLSEPVIISTLKKGQPIIASMGPGEFTTQGHYIVLTGVDKDGKIIVNDSDSKERSKMTWDIDVFMKETKNLWSFTAR